MMNNIKKKDSLEISYFRYIFVNHWDSNLPSSVSNPNLDVNHYAIE